MAAHHFCCCLPLRLGAFLISLIQFIFSALISAAAWIEITQWPHGIGSRIKGTFATVGIFYGILAIAALLGFIGTIRRSASLLGNYAFVLGWMIGVNLVIDIIYIWGYFTTPHAQLIQRCVGGATDQTIVDACNEDYDRNRWIVVASALVGLAVQTWAAYIVSSYAEKLLAEQKWRANMIPGMKSVPLDAGVGAKYALAPRTSVEEVNAPLTGASYVYPYTDTSNSYGHHAANVQTPPSAV
ncbi:hypothetical protein BV25DRAFT_1236320 [Artomyces pyxidatus]|uniref:Uncharacterized protein n=1 Tax=Artomyces pyxidatus TaxID=48021 RepID=A0ACB8SRG2_9AGAM|nr:hypothetical protein BV25DRAFT_1236320 [Artomyces pyxidatus]